MEVHYADSSTSIENVHNRKLKEMCKGTQTKMVQDGNNPKDV